MEDRRHRIRVNIASGKRRNAGSSRRNLHKTKRWKRMAKAHLARYPKCQCDHCQGHGLAADVVDHRVPARNDPKLFFDKKNLRSMAKFCHDKFKQSEEKGGAGFLQGCDANGWPLSPNHEWNRSTG